MEKKKALYESPQITTYTEEEIMEIIGPAQTCTSSGSPSGRGGRRGRPRGRGRR